MRAVLPAIEPMRSWRGRAVALLVIATTTVLLAGCRGPDAAATTGAARASEPTSAAEIDRELDEIESTLRQIEQDLDSDGAR